MSLSIGILGLPNVGKSTLFKALTKKQVDISNYPFCTVEPNIGIVEKQDQRLEKLAEIQKPEKIVPAVIKFVDVAGLVKGAHKGDGLGNQFLAHLRETDALLEIVRCFENENIAHINGRVNPEQDIDIIKSELALKDLDTINNRIEKIAKDAKQGKKQAQQELEALNNLKQSLLGSDHDRLKIPVDFDLDHLFLLTTNPRIYVLNCRKQEIPENLVKQFKEQGIDWLQFDLREELDKSELSLDEQKELGLGQSELTQLIDKCYQALDLITFFTIKGEQEARAWPIKQGSTVLQGAEMVHNDFKEKFIAAEVSNWRQVVERNGWKQCREQGLLKKVGKEYILQDGDVIEIKI